MPRQEEKPEIKPIQSGDDIRTDLEQLSSKIANLENEINQLKAQFVSTWIQLVSLTQKKAVTPKIAAPTEEDTWTRSESLLSIASTITEPLDKDTWVRNEQASDNFEPANGDKSDRSPTLGSTVQLDCLSPGGCNV